MIVTIASSRHNCTANCCFLFPSRRLCALALKTLFSIGAEETRSSQVFGHDDCPGRVQYELHIIGVGRTGDVDERVVELVVEEAALEFLVEVEDAGVEVLGRARIVREGALGHNITAHDLFGKYVFLI